MIVLKIFGIILAVILLIVAIALCLPVGVLISVDDKNGFKFLYRFLGKLYGEEPDPNNVIIKGVKKAVGISHLESVKTIRTTMENRGTAVTVKETADVLLAILNRVVWILKYCKIKKFDIVSVSAGDDAAIDYGIACAVIYPIVGYVKSNFKVNERKMNVNITCDYLNDDSSYSVYLELRVKTFHIIRALFYIVKRNLETQGVI